MKSTISFHYFCTHTILYAGLGPVPSVDTLFFSKPSNVKLEKTCPYEIVSTPCTLIMVINESMISNFKKNENKKD